ncbi:hypothetical protein RQM47_12100 [Rubrivirga sp. S365]|uniref:hypothetical protein n=1 Tax=Rubrivirga sp. S365 TaxID=3076080 RepID=UPI0028C604B5|nr:hypothetical protein [Rubrivirga sp. S365]MDT7857385.1 hypothetical protein [Rubrivirga sp. S365]
MRALVLLALLPAAALAQSVGGPAAGPDSAAAPPRPAGVLAAALEAPPLPEPAAPPEPITSMGIPPTFKPYAVGGAIWDREAGAAGGALTAGVYRDLINPIVGVGVALEGSVGWTGGGEGGARGAVRLFGSAPSLALQVGGEVRLDDPELDLVVSVLPPLRRSGPLGQGGALRIDWIPTRDHSFRLGLKLPLGQRWLGEARPRHVEAVLPRAPRADREAAPPTPPAPAVEAALREAAEGAFWLTAFNTAFLDNSGRDEAVGLEDFRRQLVDWRDSLAQRGGAAKSAFPTFAEAEDGYHAGVERAFALALGGRGGAAAADAARAALLDEVLIPYDRLIGQPRENDSLRGLFPAAQDRFGRWLADSSGADAGAQARAQDAFSHLLDIAESTRAWLLDRWHDDGRKVWLPLQLGMRPEAHDSQDELNEIVGRTVGRPLTTGNLALPINNTWFYRDLVASLHDAEDYHVLWVHDFAGYDAIGQPDTVAYRVTTAGYLDALTESVRRYDETGRLPTFLLFLDVKSYATTGGGVWLKVLQDPLRRRFSLPGDHPEMEDGVRRAQDALRAAVAGSARLQREAAERGGDGWIRDVVKVHLNITFPADFSFRSSELISWWPDWTNFLPDELMRDHRKVAFYDVTERDPRRGRGVFVGTGVGEQYASPTWEDRGVVATGPALVALKTAARELLLSQGFDADEIPPPLRAEPFPPTYDALVAELDAGGADARAINVHNEVGYAPKEATVAQATLYNLMPAGCVIYVPDSLWLSAFWSGQLVGAAFRGCAVRVIAPAFANAPSASAPVMARSRALIARMLLIQNEMEDVFAAAGGDFRVGLYTRTSEVDDLAGLLREASSQFERGAFLREEFPFPQDVYDLLQTVPDELDEAGVTVQPLVTDVVERLPKLHRKTQLLGIGAVTRQIAREMDVETVREGLRATTLGTMLADSVRGTMATRAQAQYPMVERVARLRPALRDSAVFFSLVGSMNKDSRSMMLDGETLHVVGGPWAMVHYPDFALLLGRTTWLEEQSQIDELIPPYTALERWLGRILREVL